MKPFSSARVRARPNFKQLYRAEGCKAELVNNFGAKTLFENFEKNIDYKKDMQFKNKIAGLFNIRPKL